MIKSIFIVALLLLSGFVPSKAERTLITDVVLIKLGRSDIVFNWSNSKSQIVEDKLYYDLLKRFKNVRMYVVDQIVNRSPTTAVACGKKSNLVIGDLAFLLIDKVNNLPFFKITHVQCDLIDTACPYPFGYFNAIENHRIDILNNIKIYLASKK